MLPRGGAGRLDSRQTPKGWIFTTASPGPGIGDVDRDNLLRARPWRGLDDGLDPLRAGSSLTWGRCRAARSVHLISEGVPTWIRGPVGAGPDGSGEDRGDRYGGRSRRGGRARTACGPRATSSAPRAATIAPLSVQSPGRGTRTRMPTAAARSSAIARSREFAATPPPISRCSMPVRGHGVERLAGQHVADRLLEGRRDVGDRHRLAGSARAPRPSARPRS